MSATPASRLDAQLWAPPGIERDHLRNIHNQQNVSAIKQFLLVNSPNRVHSVRSVWIDAKPLCHVPSSSLLSRSMVELGDLAIVIRRATSQGLLCRMWVLQGKMSGSNPFAKSAKEVELYEHLNHNLWHDVEIYQSAHRSQSPARTPRGRRLSKFPIDLASQFGAGGTHTGDPPFWSYLMFERTASSVPIYHAWPSSAHAHVHCGFSDGLLRMDAHVGTGLHTFGADLVRGGPWMDVYDAIRRCQLRRTTYTTVTRGSNVASPGTASTITRMMTAHEALLHAPLRSQGIFVGDPGDDAFDDLCMRSDRKYNQLDEASELDALPASEPEEGEEGFVLLIIDQVDEPLGAAGYFTSDSRRQFR